MVWDHPDLGYGSELELVLVEFPHCDDVLSLDLFDDRLVHLGAFRPSQTTRARPPCQSTFSRATMIEREAVVAANRRCERLTQAVLGKAFRGELVPSGMAEFIVS